MHWGVQREKESFCTLSAIWVGVESGKHVFFNSHTQKKEENLCLIPRQVVLVLSLIFRKENMAKFKTDTCMKRRKHEQDRKAVLEPILS